MNKENLLIELIWPLKEIDLLLKNIILIIFGTIIITISAKIQVPFWPVPMTMQTYAVLVIAIIYGWKLSLATLTLYLLEGAFGIPVFAKGGGLAYLLGPTAGYLFGMLLAACIVGYLGEKGYGKTLIKSLLALFVGSIIIFFLRVYY